MNKAKTKKPEDMSEKELKKYMREQYRKAALATPDPYKKNRY